MKKWLVYKHTSPSGKIYIGITQRDPHTRWGKDGKNYKNCKFFYHAIQKYGWDNINHEIILDGISCDEAKYTEKYLIRWYKIHHNSYNITDGGDGTLGIVYSKETLSKMREAKLGKPLSAEHVAKIRANAAKLKGIPRSEEIKRKLHEANKGKKPSPQTIAALKEYNKTRVITEETRRKLSEVQKNRDHTQFVELLNSKRKQIGIKHRKAVVQLSLDGQYISEYEGSKFASLTTGIDASMITACCKGRQFKAGGFLWMYKSIYNACKDNNSLKDKLVPIITKANMIPGTYIRTEEWRKQASDIRKGIDCRSEDRKEYMQECSIKATSKPVLQMTLDKSIVAVYPSASSIRQFSNYDISSICKCCRGKVSNMYGYLWQYITNEEYNKYKEK